MANRYLSLQLTATHWVYFTNLLIDSVMPKHLQNWDYLIVTASNEAQARAYETQLDLRRRLGLLAEVNEVLVVADPGGKRIGSGGSTLCCLMEVLRRELGGKTLDSDENTWQDILSRLRILIVHAGGDSRRLPAYGPCGKLFIPVPGETDSCLPLTLFDRQLPVYLALPAPDTGSGQVVITSGDVLLSFDPSTVHFAAEGLTGLGCLASPEQARYHGVFCRGEDAAVRFFSQKPSPAQQKKMGLLNMELAIPN